MPPLSRRSESWGRFSVRASGARESWLSAMTGTDSYLASPFRDRLIEDTSCWRFSIRPAPVMSCR
jgi:hypothetical protein